MLLGFPTSIAFASVALAAWAVVAAFRYGKEEGTLGSLILGLYAGKELRPIGHTSGLKAKEKKELVKTLKPYETGELGSGATSPRSREPPPLPRP